MPLSQVYMAPQFLRANSMLAPQVRCMTISEFTKGRIGTRQRRIAQLRLHRPPSLVVCFAFQCGKQPQSHCRSLSLAAGRARHPGYFGTRRRRLAPRHSYRRCHLGPCMRSMCIARFDSTEFDVIRCHHHASLAMLVVSTTNQLLAAGAGVPLERSKALMP